MTERNSNAPEAVIARNQVRAQEVKSVNRNLFFYMEFKFFKFNHHAAYSINNDLDNVESREISVGGIRLGADYERNTIGDIAEITGLSRDRITGRRESENQRRQTVHEYLTTPETTIVLPLPAELMESYAVEFQQAGVGLIGRTILDAVINGGVSIGEAEEALRRVGTAVVGNLVSSLPENLQSVAEISRGKVINPVYQTVFRGVPIRSHEFSWKLAPESSQEQADIEAVLNALRRHSLPPFERSGEINNIMYPDFCKISLKPNIFKFPKPLFISSLSINHAPEGVPAFYHDEKPVGYEIRMRLTEATALVRQDIIQDEEEQQTT